jgi:chromosome segregation ATPase
MNRDITNDDLVNVDQAIGSLETYQRHLYVLRRVLGELGKLNISGIKQGVEAEKARLAEANQRANAAQSDLDKLLAEIEGKKRELAGVEATIAEKELRSAQLSDGITGLRNMLAAA